jgi:hypothetical protein
VCGACHLYIFFSEMSAKVHRSIFNQVSYFLIFQFTEFWVYFRYQSSIRYVFCKYFLLVCGLSFYSHDRVFLRTENFNFNKV